MISFARALGTAQTGDIPSAQVEIAKLQSLEDKLLEVKDTYWANQIEVERLAAAGVLAHVQGDDKKALELVRAAADLAGTMDKHPATPASVLPARELLADLLLELNQPREAFNRLRKKPETITAYAISRLQVCSVSKFITPLITFVNGYYAPSSFSAAC